jgi:hypothetical protein
MSNGEEDDIDPDLNIPHGVRTPILNRFNTYAESMNGADRSTIRSGRLS